MFTLLLTGVSGWTSTTMSSEEYGVRMVTAIETNYSYTGGVSYGSVMSESVIQSYTQIEQNPKHDQEWKVEWYISVVCMCPFQQCDNCASHGVVVSHPLVVTMVTKIRINLCKPGCCGQVVSVSACQAGSLWNMHVGKVTDCYAGHIHCQRCHTRGESQGTYITYASAKFE